MSCHHFKIGNTTGIITLPNIYKYKGFVFEYHPHLGPVKLKKKDLEPAAKEGRQFYKVINEWEKLTKRQKEKTRIYG